MKKLLCVIFGFYFLFFNNFFASENPIVSNLQAFSNNNAKVAVVWTLPEEDLSNITNVVLYRTKSIVTNFDQIKDLEPVTVLDTYATQYVDTLTDYDDYYYSVVLITNKGPSTLILLSFNSTIKSVHLKLPEKKEVAAKVSDQKKYDEGTMRETPLPYLDLLETPENKSNLSDKTVKATQKFVSDKIAKKEEMSIYIFEEDLISPDGGDDFILFDILKNTFIQMKYPEAINQLKRLIGTKISEQVQNRALFYLGEAQYFAGFYEDSVKSFLKVENIYPALSNKWISSAIEKVEIN